MKVHILQLPTAKSHRAREHAESLKFVQSVNYLLGRYRIIGLSFLIYLLSISLLLQIKLIGYEPAGLTVHPPPRMIEGGFIFFEWVSSVTKIFSSKKSGFCRRYSHWNAPKRGFTS